MSGVTPKALASLIYGIRQIFDNGVEKPLQSALNFVGFTVTNDSTNGRTTITSSAGVSLSSSNPSPIGSVNPGSGSTASKYDHVHAHGDQLGGTLHSAVTSLSNGFMIASDKALLDTKTDAATASALCRRGAGGDCSFTEVNASTQVSTPFVTSAGDLALDAGAGSDISMTQDEGDVTFLTYAYDDDDSISSITAPGILSLAAGAGGVDISAIAVGDGVTLCAAVLVTVPVVGSVEITGEQDSLTLQCDGNMVIKSNVNGSVTIGAANTDVMAVKNATQSTVGAAGGASALPATPTGYLEININGTPRVIPFYAKT